jgi:hypothetical protein
MALTDARVLRSLKLTEAKGEKGSIQYSGSQELLILSDSKDPSFSGILADATVWPNLGNKRLPQIDDEESVNGVRLYVTSRELSYYKDNERAVVMAVRYDAKDADAGGESDGDPTAGDSDAWQRIQIQSVDVTQPARGWKNAAAAFGQDATGGSPAANSAGDPVDGIEEEASMLRFTYTNTIAPNPSFAALANYHNTCNGSKLQLLGIECENYTVRCTGFNAQYDQKNNVWSVTVELLYKPDGWYIVYFDAGFNEIVNGRRTAIVDGAGNPISTPVPLDGLGKALPVANLDDSQTSGGLNERFLFPYPGRDFGSLFRDARI